MQLLWREFAAQGPSFLGKANVPELFLTNETDNAVYGRTNNPFDLSRIPGGSGGGHASIFNRKERRL
ncbi:MAG: amidase family protein [Terriglobia bacterium]